MPHFGVRIAARAVGSTALEFSDHADQFVEAGGLSVPALDDLVLHEGVLGSPLRGLERLVAVWGDVVPASARARSSFSKVSPEGRISLQFVLTNRALPTFIEPLQNIVRLRMQHPLDLLKHVMGRGQVGVVDQVLDDDLELGRLLAGRCSLAAMVRALVADLVVVVEIVPLVVGVHLVLSGLGSEVCGADAGA